MLGLSLLQHERGDKVSELWHRMDCTNRGRYLLGKMWRYFDN